MQINISDDDTAQIEALINICAMCGLPLDWSGDTWPQPKLMDGPTINWDEMRIEGPRPVSCSDSWDAITEEFLRPRVAWVEDQLRTSVFRP